MNTYTAILSVVFALILALLFSGSWTALAAESGTATATGPQVAPTSQSHYGSLMERLQKQWRVDPHVAEAHNLSPTGWATPACAPRSQGQIQTTAGGGADNTEKCVQKCLKRTSLENPNGLLLCRSSCL